MEYPTLPLSYVEWLYIYNEHSIITVCVSGVEVESINLLLALTLAGIFCWATLGWASCNIDTFVTLV